MLQMILTCVFKFSRNSSSFPICSLLTLQNRTLLTILYTFCQGFKNSCTTPTHLCGWRCITQSPSFVWGKYISLLFFHCKWGWHISHRPVLNTPCGTKNSAHSDATYLLLFRALMITLTIHILSEDSVLDDWIIIMHHQLSSFLLLFSFSLIDLDQPRGMCHRHSRASHAVSRADFGSFGIWAYMRRALRRV